MLSGFLHFSRNITAWDSLLKHFCFLWNSLSLNIRFFTNDVSTCVLPGQLAETIFHPRKTPSLTRNSDQKEKRHRHENTNAKRTTSILRPGNRLHEVRRVAVGQYGPVHCPSFRPSSRSFTWLFLPVRGHNERFLASPIVPFRSMSFVPTIRPLDPRRPLLHAQVTRNLFLGSLLGNVSNVIYKSQTKRVHWSQIIVCVFFAASSIKIFFSIFTREFFIRIFTRRVYRAVKIDTDVYIYTHTYIHTIHACTYMRITFPVKDSGCVSVCGR